MGLEEAQLDVPVELSLSPEGRVYLNRDRQPDEQLPLAECAKIEDLFAQASMDSIIAASQPSADALEDSDLSTVFGIEMAPAAATKKASSATTKKGTPPRPKKKEPLHSDKQMELSVSQAAILLRLSEARLLRLLDEKMIPFRREGKDHWIGFKEIIKYRQKRGKA